ncbi:MAG: hypothetical protein JKY37_04360 [Nannocystaceae bacterium]|nr:hypothetical protein [Nannocystaceae bacterium]
MESDVVPEYAAQGLRFFPVYSAVESDRGANLLEDFGVTSDVIADPESELFRQYRVAGAVFPLNVVIGRDGTVVHIDNAFGIDDAVAAIAAAI